jgi:hypothetical protein
MMRFTTTTLVNNYEKAKRQPTAAFSILRGEEGFKSFPSSLLGFSVLT